MKKNITLGITSSLILGVAFAHVESSAYKTTQNGNASKFDFYKIQERKSDRQGTANYTAVAEEAAAKALAEQTAFKAAPAADLKGIVFDGVEVVELPPEVDLFNVANEQNKQAEVNQLIQQKKTIKQKSETEKTPAQELSAITKVARYKTKIIRKIRRNIMRLPDIPRYARADFEVTLLPGGMVLNAILVKPSGYAAFDSAVERAIKKAEPLPLPPDAALFDIFRELRISFSP